MSQQNFHFQKLTTVTTFFEKWIVGGSRLFVDKKLMKLQEFFTCQQQQTISKYFLKRTKPLDGA